MKFPGKLSFITIGVFAILFSVVFNLSADGLQGINAADTNPNGCVSCHKQNNGADYRLNTMMGDMDDHPSITKMVNNVPQDCMMCHGKDSYGGELSAVVHEAHFEDPDENHFISYYGGDCLNCHSMNVRTGTVTVKSGPKNW